MDGGQGLHLIRSQSETHPGSQSGCAPRRQRKLVRSKMSSFRTVAVLSSLQDNLVLFGFITIAYTHDTDSIEVLCLYKSSPVLTQ